MKITYSELKEVMFSPFSSYLPDNIQSAFIEAMMNGDEQVEVPSSFHVLVANAEAKYTVEKAEQIIRDTEYEEISQHRLSGMEKESNSDNEGAISEYAVAIILGEQSKFNLFHAYDHAYERIIVCLHKAKRFDKEASYIERYLKYDLSEATRSKYSTRLEKLKSKIQQ